MRGGTAASLRGGTAAEAFAPGVPVIVMTHPTGFQVMNIVEMYEKDIIPLDHWSCWGSTTRTSSPMPRKPRPTRRLSTTCEENGISWVRFRKITGRVESARTCSGRTSGPPQFREIFAAASGFIFTGGMDIPPAVYGQGIRLMTEPTTPARSLFEISFLFHLLGGRQNPGFTPFLAARRDFPVLAICLGMQSLNVAAGGTLIQDIPTEVYGRRTVEEVLAAGPDQVHSGVYLEKLYPNDPELTPPFHRLRLDGESMFVRRMGFSRNDLPFVATAHHQAIGKLGGGLRVTATSLDGKIIEAAEHDRFVNVLGIQFHPERHTLYRKGLFLRPRPDAPWISIPWPS